MEFDVETYNYGKFVVEPLERGFGLTIGNALRRVMMSSLLGAAFTGVRINGVKHEFSTISGCVEDVSEIILNLKEVVLEIEDKEKAELRLEAKGPCEVTAGMIAGEANVKVVNPDLHICSLHADGEISMDLIATVSRGYVIAEEIQDEEAPVDMVPLDAAFSPVRKVNHFVTNARVGQRTDYDKLTVEVWTDGSLTPDSAIRSASYILKDHMTVFAGVSDEVEEVQPAAEEEKPKWNESLFRRIDELELSVRSSNCLENADIKYIGELVQRTEAEMLRTKNFGRKSLNEIKEIMVEMNLTLGMKLENFPNREELERISEESGSAFV